MSVNDYWGYIHDSNSLKHGRTYGSENGKSNNPHYIPYGHPAVGVRQPDGSYVYSDTGKEGGVVKPGSANNTSSVAQKIQKAATPEAIKAQAKLERLGRSGDTQQVKAYTGTSSKADHDFNLRNKNEALALKGRELRDKIDAKLESIKNKIRSKLEARYRKAGGLKDKFSNISAYLSGLFKKR